MRKIGISIFILTLLISSLLSAVSADNEMTKELEKGSMPNVIFMIGDGMAYEHVKAASLIEYGELNQTIMQTEFPVQSLYTHDTVDGKITDSGAGGTALATGQLTKYGSVSMDETDVYYFKTILEYLQYDFGYVSGVITTTDFYHATPASFTSHSDDRDDFKTIKDQMFALDMNVIMGGGLTGATVGGENGANNLGTRYHYDVATNVTELLSLTETSDRLLGIFPRHDGDDSVDYEVDRETDVAPSLLQMTESAITVLKRQNKPYFLMIEGGRIDHAAHAHLLKEMIIDTIMFDKSVEYAINVAKADGNTIVIVGADHETGGFKVLDYSGLSGELPSDDNTREENMQIRKARIANLTVSWSSFAHTRTPVTFYGYGADFTDIPININTDVYWALVNELGAFPGVLNRDFVLNGDVLEVRALIKDTDKTATRVDIHVDYKNEPDVIISEDLVFDEITTEISLNITLAETDYTVFIKVIDGGINDVTSFDNNDDLPKIKVTYVTDETSISTTETSETPSASETETTNYNLAGLCLIVAVPVLRKMKN